MVHLVGYNLHKILKHEKQFCIELHTYVVKCKNTYGMINNVQPGSSTVWLLHTF